MSKALGSKVWMSLFSGLVCLLGMATAAADPALHGRWSFDDEGETRFSEFFSDGRAVMDGDPFQYRASDGQLVLIYQSIELPGQYQISGNRLTISMFDEVTVYTRVGAAPTKVQASSSASPAVPAARPSGKLPADGRWLQVQDNGFDVLLSGDYEKLQAVAGGFVIGSSTLPGMVLVYPNPALTSAEIDQGAAQGYSDETIQLQPSGAARSIQAGNGRGKQVPVTGALNGESVQGYLAGYTNGQGSGVTIIAFTTPEAWSQMQTHAETMTGSVRLYTPETSPRLAQARQALAGNSLVWSHNSNQVSMNSSGYHTGSAVNAFEAWHCCANGRGRYEGARSMSYQGGGLAGSSESGPGAWDGSWSLNAQGEDFVLVFQFDDGSSNSWVVTVDENENVAVDGKRVEVKQDSICQ